MTELAKLRDKYEIVGDVRGKGLQIGVEMVKDKVWWWRSPLVTCLCNVRVLPCPS